MNIEVNKHIEKGTTSSGVVIKNNGISELRIYFEEGESYNFKEEIAQVLEIFTQMAKKNTKL